MKKLHLLIFLSLVLIVIPLVSYKGFLNAAPSSSDSSNEDAAVSKDVTVKDEGISNDTSGQSPKIYFENPNYDFGKIIKGQKVEYVYKFENQGNIDLEIIKVKSSCGCTAAILSDKIIPPGKMGEIKATFNSGSYSGKVMKSITVLSNDPGKASYKLTITGNIEEIISANPKSINFGPIHFGGKVDKTINIVSSSGHDFKIEKIKPSIPLVSATISEKFDNGYIINVALNDNQKIGRFNGSIYIETDNLKQKKVKIPFYGEIQGDITTYPKKIYYGKIVKGKERVQRIFVKVNKDNIEILDVKVSPDYLSAKIIEDYKKNNAQHLIEVKLHSNATIGELKGSLEISTNSEIQSSIIVPIVGVIIKAS